tara:strand:+ start:479 stop:976 length:498 start_codon:yes stop_codon:yes gene_type:complete
MIQEIIEEDRTGLLIKYYKNDNIYPLLPLLSQEFPNWTVDKIKNYIKLVISKNNDVAGILVAQNDAQYNVGMLIYTYQTITSDLIGNSKNKFVNGIVVENLNASSPILQKQVFFILIEKVMKFAKEKKCEFIELPKFDESYELINQKYKSQISNPNNFRVFIKLN